MAESMPLLSVDAVSVTFGGIVALDGLTFAVEQGQIAGLIGPNGAGKTTLFNVISRLYEPTSGHITFDGHDLLTVPAHRIARIGIARTFQNLALWPGLTVLENVMVGAHSRSHVGFARSALRLGSCVRRAAAARGQLRAARRARLGRRTRSVPRPGCPSARSNASRSRVRWPPGRSSSSSTSRRAG